MGYAKNHGMEIDERGYGDSDIVICSDCINNTFLKDYCVKNRIQATCSYCDCSSEICIQLEDLMVPIMEGINHFYESAEQYYCHDKEMDDYVCSVIDKDDLINYTVAEDLEFSEDILNDIANLIIIEDWCEIDPFMDSESSTMQSLWNSFVQMITKESRYVFFKRSTQPSHEYYNMEPFEILEYIGDMVNKLNLFFDIPVNFPIYRARMHSRSQIKKMSNEKELGSPPWSVAQVNRMSAEGISIFYGASNITTALHEVYSSAYEMATVGEFFPSRALHCIDLDAIEKLPFPNIFDIDMRDFREAILFLCALQADLSRNIASMKAVEYVPAQIISEYFRYVFKDSSEKKIDGIIYNSAQNPNKGKCYALFFDNEKCQERFGDCSDPIKIEEWVLRLNTGNIQHFDAHPPYPQWVPEK